MGLHKCGDYSSGRILSRKQRNEKRRDDFSDYIEKGELVEEFQSSTSISSQRNPQDEANPPPNNAASNSSCNTQCIYCLKDGPLANVVLINFEEGCGHRILCDECIDKYQVGDSCPKCNRQINMKQRIFNNTI